MTPETPPTVPASPGPLTDDEIRELERLDAAASVGLWFVDLTGSIRRDGTETGWDGIVASSVGAHATMKPSRQDSDYIVAMRNALPALLADRQRQATEVARLRETAIHRDAHDMVVSCGDAEAVLWVMRNSESLELVQAIRERDAARAELAAARHAPAEIARRSALYRDFNIEAERDDRAEVWDSARKLAEEYASAPAAPTPGETASDLHRARRALRAIADQCVWEDDGQPREDAQLVHDVIDELQPVRDLWEGEREEPPGETEEPPGLCDATLDSEGNAFWRCVRDAEHQGPHRNRGRTMTWPADDPSPAAHDGVSPASGDTQDDADPSMCGHGPEQRCWYCVDDDELVMGPGGVRAGHTPGGTGPDEGAEVTG